MNGIIVCLVSQARILGDIATAPLLCLSPSISSDHQLLLMDCISHSWLLCSQPVLPALLLTPRGLLGNEEAV